MRVVKQLSIAFLVFVISVPLCAAGGGLVGDVIAMKFPHYYPSVFPEAATQPWIDAHDVGIGTGIGQGAAAGVVVGGFIVVALAIANWRREGRSG
jgi:hypothetical protein